MAKDQEKKEETHRMQREEEEEEEEEESENWDDWNKNLDDEEEEMEEFDFKCLFCDSTHASCDSLLQHCRLTHHFDFHAVRKAFALDFYASFKLINYIRSQVAENSSWSFELTGQPGQNLEKLSHETVNGIKLLWDDDKYLKPVMEDDSLLYSFAEDEEGEDDDTTSVDKEELMRDLRNFENMIIIDENNGEKSAFDTDIFNEDGTKVLPSSNGHLNMRTKMEAVIGMESRTTVGLGNRGLKDKHLIVLHGNSIAKDIENVNENYFGAYSSFGIHREMISDKVRMDAYRQAILKNPSLFRGAVVMDVGCGTGILSLFAAQAGASRVMAVEASEKMAAVATRIAKDNNLLQSKTQNEGNNQCTGVIEVVQGMVEDLHKSIQIQPHGIDVLLSEWMGYCLLYESMLSSVLFARDTWLKPGGAILPDTATIFVAGFGRGGTSIPFWENVYGFNMSCVGQELVQDAAQNPILDVVDDRDLVTNAVVLQTFDLVKMKPDEVDFTASIELEPKLGSSTGNFTELIAWCYGVVLWFDTGFSSRFCKEMPAVLSTSPYTPKTHWSQTILTFQEPLAMALRKPSADRSAAAAAAAVGTDECPAARLSLRISIARATKYRSIDISVETAGVGPHGQKRSLPVQIFNIS
ncbi:Methyltransf_18 domain-containing protein [Cephalotus follicularis]|uniref:Methyltransf_18 domain-containing protein n=1 Tax=Cephalotus follicularis TaxID=3775 RepID=A0A1Q3BDR4_CEPFO|nr:Methyltransf_18 domain-containing protein [Cephalotus follicularis]